MEQAEVIKLRLRSTKHCRFIGPFRNVCACDVRTYRSQSFIEIPIKMISPNGNGAARRSVSLAFPRNDMLLRPPAPLFPPAQSMPGFVDCQFQNYYYYCDHQENVLPLLGLGGDKRYLRSDFKYHFNIAPLRRYRAVCIPSARNKLTILR